MRDLPKHSTSLFDYNIEKNQFDIDISKLGIVYEGSWDVVGVKVYGFILVSKRTGEERLCIKMSSELGKYIAYKSVPATGTNEKPFTVIINLQK